MRFISKNRVVTLLVSFALVAGGFVLVQSRAEAACTDPNPSFGIVSFNNLTVPETGTYRVWSRMQIPSTANNSYQLEVNGGTCFNVHGNGGLPKNDWNWIDFHSGSANSKVNVSLTAGTPFSMRLLGTSEGVLVDRIIFTKVTNGETCTPDGLGNDCAEPIDTQNPTVSLTSPAASPTVLTGTQAVSATASDNVRVKQVEFTVNGAPIGSPDTTSPFSVDWNTLLIADGTYTIAAKAIDDAGNNSTSTRQVTVQNGKPDLIVSGITITPTSPKVGDSVQIKATIRNQGSAATVASTQMITRFTVGGGTLSDVTYTPAIAANASVEITSNINWTATAGTTQIIATVDNTNLVNESNESNNTVNPPVSVAVSSPDTTAPTVSFTAPANNSSNLSGSVNVTVAASDNSGGSGMKQVDFFVNGQFQQSITSSPYTFAWNTAVLSDGTHTVSARAQDQAGNYSQTRSITVTTSNAPPTTAVPGDADGNGRVEYADLLRVLNNWGQSGRTKEQGNVDGTGSVGYNDLLLVLNNWTQQ